MSGNGNHATVYHATLTTDRFGNARSAYSFGQNSIIADTLRNSLNKEMSISLWVNISRLNAGYMGNNGYYQPGWSGSLINLHGHWGARDYNVLISEAQEDFEVDYWRHVFSSSLGFGWYSIYYPKIQTNIWYHYVVNVSECSGYGGLPGIREDFYIDGSNKSSLGICVSGLDYTIAHYGFSLGGESDGGFRGVLDDVRIYNRTLSDAEVMALYMEGISTSKANFVQTESDETTSNEMEAPTVQAYIYNDRLTIHSPSEEKISIYSIHGSVLYQAKKPAGVATFNIGELPRGILIVRGSSGWVKKIIVQ
jgi:hypothetical protein